MVIEGKSFRMKKPDRALGLTLAPNSPSSVTPAVAETTGIFFRNGTVVLKPPVLGGVHAAARSRSFQTPEAARAHGGEGCMGVLDAQAALRFARRARSLHFQGWHLVVQCLEGDPPLLRGHRHIIEPRMAGLCRFA